MISSNYSKSNYNPELTSAIIGYLNSCGLKSTAECLSAETGISNEHNSRVLETRWNSVLMLQKKIYDLENPSSKKTRQMLPMGASKYYDQHHEAINCVSIFDSLLASGDGIGKIKIWDLDSNDCLFTLRGHLSAIQSVAWSNDGKILASSSADGAIKLFHAMNKFECFKTWNAHESIVSCLCFSSDSSMLFSGSKDQSVCIWNINSSSSNDTIQGNEWVRSLDVFGSIFVIACGSHLVLWDWKLHQKITELRGHSHLIDCTKFVPKDLQVQGIQSLTSTNSKYPNSCRFVASASRDKTIIIWDWISKTNMMTFTDHQNWVTDLDFFKTYLVSVSEDKTCRIWDLSTNQVVKVFKDHSKFVTCVAASSIRIVTGSLDERLSIYEC